MSCRLPQLLPSSGELGDVTGALVTSRVGHPVAAVLGHHAAGDEQHDVHHPPDADPAWPDRGSTRHMVNTATSVV